MSIQIATMPLSSKSDSNQEQECSICYETPKFSTVTTKCGHTFCFDCYKQHVESGQNYSHKCPNCRKPISEVGENLVAREEYLGNLPPANLAESNSEEYDLLGDEKFMAACIFKKIFNV